MEGAGQIDANLNGDLCSKPLLDTPIPLVAQDENAGTTTHNPDPTPKKKKKKSVQGEQACDPSIPVGVEADVTKEGAGQIDANLNGDLCSKPLLDTPIPVVAQDENVGTTSQNPNSTPKKKKKKSVQGSQACDPSILIGVEPNIMKEEGAQPSDADLNGDLCSKALLDTPIPIVQQDENAERTAQNVNPTFQKKKKNMPGAQQLQTCNQPDVPDPKPIEDTPRKKTRKKKNVLEFKGAEPVESNNIENPELSSLVPDLENKMKEGAEDDAEQSRVCPNPELAPPSDIAIPSDLKLKKTAQSIEANVEHPLAGSKPELASPTRLPVPMNLEKKKEPESSEAHAQHPQPQPCSKYVPVVSGINEECPVPDATTPEDTPQIKKSRKKKNVLKPLGAEPEPESKEANNTENLQQCPPDSEPKIKMKKESEANAENFPVCPKPELAPMLGIPFPNDSDVKKGAEPTEARLEHPQVCSEPKLVPPTDLPTPINPEKKKVVEPSKVFAQPQPCSTPSAEPLDDPTTPVDQSRRKQKSKRGRVKIMCSEEKVENQGSPLHVDIALNQAPNQVQQNPATPICLQPAFLTDQTIPVDPANPIDTDQKMKKKKRKKQKEGEEPNNSKHDTEQPESPIQTATCLIATPSIHPAIPMDPCPVIPICPAISTDPVQDMSKKKMKKKKNSALEIEGAEPIEQNDKLLEAPPEAAVQKSIYPIAATSIDPPIIPIGTAPPVDTEISLDLGQKMTEKKRKKKKRSELTSVGAEPNEPIGMPPETPVQDSVYPIVAPSIDPIISVSAPPEDTANPIDQGQKTSKKKRKRSDLIREGAELNKHDAEPPGTPVQRSLYPIAAPSIDTTIPTSQASPVDPEQMTKKKKKRKSALKNEGLESEKHNADPSTETSVQKTEDSTPSVDPTISTSQSTPLDPEQMTKKKKKRKSSLQNEVLESEKHNANPTTETPVQKTEDPAPSIEPTIPTSQATPVDLELMTKKKKIRKNALKNEGLESEEHNADPSTETSVQKTEDSAPLVDPTISTNQSTPLDPEQMTKKKKKSKSSLKNEGLESKKHNANPTTETPVQKTEDPAPSIDPKIPTSRATPVQARVRKTGGPTTENSKRCQACRQLGHKFQQCPRLRNLSNNEEICFFCGEIGHSLGKCHAARAERAMFANCLFCHEDRHFSYNCPRNGHGIDQKVVAADGVINRTVDGS
ncbi:proteoglycan 4 isoform X2 [Cajanus cajan]|uniref:proteoglycan 4 isoform X2 n=1 Tax=Cajanus cajan TaxID=3821 RepID=UPI00098DA54A|nr:proteoglycan 4 isoform X2 [Cajanus cajan]